MNRDLLLAILSMDSYNRGYGVGIKDLGGIGSRIGNALLKSDSSVLVGDEGERLDSPAGFYAIAYDMTGVAGFVSGEKVMS